MCAKVGSRTMLTRTTDSPAQLATPTELRRWALRCHAAGMTVGLVPTMGALHAGHRSLMRRAVSECDRVVVSIFVNPAQFGPGEDFERYPRALAGDLALVTEERVDAVFVPSAGAIYPPTMSTGVTVHGITQRFEGEFRPGHFEGVALVVAKLFISCRPDRAYFGRKDAQQCAVVTRIAEDLDTGVQVVVCPTVRDCDGLALSSRNANLTREDRLQARAIPTGLAAAADLYAAGERSSAGLRRAVENELDAASIEADYVAVVDSSDFADVATARSGCEILVAARIGGTRLIDQLRLGLDKTPVIDGAAGALCSGF